MKNTMRHVAVAQHIILLPNRDDLKKINIFEPAGGPWATSLTHNHGSQNYVFYHHIAKIKIKESLLEMKRKATKVMSFSFFFFFR